MTEGICDFAIWRPGPKWKAGYTVFGRTSDKHGVVDHSSEGPLAATFGVLDSWRTASWQFTNDDSALYQHYPISDVCWHAGFEANKKFVGVESTGWKGGGLTDRQYGHLLALHLWLRGQGVLTVCERRVDLWEHNEWMATDCPSGRIPWDRLIADLKEEPMPETEWERYTKLLAQELDYFQDIEGSAHNLRQFALHLQATWRRSDSEPALDGPIWSGVSKECDWMIQCANALKKRCSLLGRPG